MKVRIDPELCMGHCMCATMAPQVYTVSDDGFNEMGEFEVSATLEAFAREGARACPEGAITIFENRITR